MTDRDDPTDQSQTAHILHELQLYGHRPYEDEPNPRPLPEGDRVAGALADIFAALDRVRAKHPDMVLLYGGAPSGAERIAACWADNRKVCQVAFKPDWNRHGKAAPFRRNDALLEVLPIGVVVFPGMGIQDNLADKARKLGIPLLDFRQRGA